MRRKLILSLTALSILAVVPLYAVKVSRKTDYTDFGVYYQAAERVTQRNWLSVYTMSDGASPFRYAPPVLPLFRPLGSLSPYASKMLWYFLQTVWFGLGFYFLYRSLKADRRLRSARNGWEAITLTALSYFFVLRFCLDTLTIGQVSSLMFLGFCLGLYGWVLNRPGLASTGLFIPTILKIGPGFNYLLFACFRLPRLKRAIWTPILISTAMCAALLVWVGSLESFQDLWKGWVMIVQNDSVYYDASHYGSQSIKSALLRMAKSGWITSDQVSVYYLLSAAVGTTLILALWLLRSARTAHSRGLFYAMGLFPYLWFMPETFKYSLTPLAIPVAFLLATPRLDRWARSALGFGFLTLSAAGKDIVGDPVFFGLQNVSAPLIATLLLGTAVYRQAWRSSMPSRVALMIRNPRSSLGPWTTLPQSPQSPALAVSALVPLPLDSNTALSSSLIIQTIQALSAFLEKKTQGSFEILVIPFGNRVSESHPIVQELKRHSQMPIRLLPPPSISGRGSALRVGFLQAQGSWMITTHLEQPADVSFFDEALPLLDQGYDLIRANRRLPETRFKTPVRLLSLVYGRHRMGLLFNRLVRALLPIQTTDTHSGTLAFRRSLGVQIFALQTSAEFLFDLEASLTAHAHGAREKDLPLTLYLAEEKNFKRMVHETLNILFGLPLLAWRYRLGCYRPTTQSAGITADDWGLSPGINQGILELAKKGIIRRVSIMATCPAVAEGLDELKALPNVELGLHFNLTYGRRLSRTIPEHSGPKTVLVNWLFGNRSQWKDAVRTELQSQLGELKKLGVKAQYIDGHHHIHLVPGLMDAIADIIRSAGIRYVRLPYDPTLWFTSKFPLAVLCVLARARIKSHGFTYLPCFYPQKADFLDQGRLRVKLAKHSGSEVIVHPARSNDLESLEYPDCYTDGRVVEFHALQMLTLPATLAKGRDASP